MVACPAAAIPDGTVAFVRQFVLWHCRVADVGSQPQAVPGGRTETKRLALVACLLAVIPALNLATSDAAAVAGLVMTVLTVGLVSCSRKSLPRFWPGRFFLGYSTAGHPAAAGRSGAATGEVSWPARGRSRHEAEHSSIDRAEVDRYRHRSGKTEGGSACPQPWKTIINATTPPKWKVKSRSIGRRKHPSRAGVSKSGRPDRRCPFHLNSAHTATRP